MPQADAKCSSIIFDGNILISGYINRNLLLYSIDIDSFSIISSEFAEYKRKILANAERRLYLIESKNGSIYESKIGSFIDWTWVADSTIDFNPPQVYCLYNKGAIYIGCIDEDEVLYFKLNLDTERSIALESIYF
ncbi:unnamed protein product [Blepharisma stoltei]|uniref:Uncharacterized protein n=1 Tax=Blepharisma stoltei TaxID=1481888 RepID=A0AAU9K6X1_9CILI|nr:unnamed protein product [Blepharisma stoltei]